MNDKLTIQEADWEISRIKHASIISKPVQDSAQWVCVIIAELRQQLGLGWNCTMAELYTATVNMRDKDGGAA